MHLSSIFSSETWQARWQWAPWMLIFVGLILTAEMVLRVPTVRKTLPAPEPTLWHAELVNDKVDYLKTFAAGRGIDVLFLGNSTMQAGLNPAAFDKARGAANPGGPGAFNGSIEGMPPYGTDLFLDIYLRHSRPDTIIYGLTPQDLNGHSPWAADITDRVKHSPMVLAEARRGFKGQALAFLLDHSQLFRYRLVLYRLLLADPSVHEAPTPYFDERGYHHLESILAEVPPQQRGVYYNSAGVLNYDTKGLQLESLRRLIERVQAEDIHLILVNMPLADDYYGNFDAPETDYALYMETLTAVSQEYGVPLIDAESSNALISLTDRHFADFNHLNQEGAMRLSAALATQYLALRTQSDTAVSP